MLVSYTAIVIGVFLLNGAAFLTPTIEIL